MSSLSSPVAKSLEASLADAQSVLSIPPAELANALRATLKYLSPQAISELFPALTPGKEAPASVETEGKLRPENQTAGREITLNDGSRAIEMQVPVNGQIIRAVLSGSSFNKSRPDQASYARGLGGRLATREESYAVANDLLEKEEKGTLNLAEQKLLRTYREKYVRDSEGGLGVDGRRVSVYDVLYAFGRPSHGALVVLPLAESK